jgi:hypothetical protein
LDRIRAPLGALCRMTRVLLPGLCLTGNLAGCAAVSPLAIPARDSGSVEGDLGCTLSIARHRLLLVGLASGRPRWAGAEQLGELHPGPVQAAGNLDKKGHCVPHCPGAHCACA